MDTTAIIGAFAVCFLIGWAGSQVVNIWQFVFERLRSAV